jgi:hypothetical protein
MHPVEIRMSNVGNFLSNVGNFSFEEENFIGNAERFSKTSRTFFEKNGNLKISKKDFLKIENFFKKRTFLKKW